MMPPARFTNAVLASGGTVSDSHAYAYDPAGNRLQEQLLAATNQYAYNALNQLINGTTPPTNTAYSWDAEHRLVAITTSGQQTDFTYDGLGRCVGMSQSVGGIVVSNRQFLWCGNDICEQHTPAGAL